MRVLCLHGSGTNSRILRAQIEPFRRLLPAHYEFFYLEGEYECGPAEGVADVFPGPYLCYYPMPPTRESLRRAHDRVLETVERDGPFDIVLGFSQGAALAASVLLHDAASTTLGKSQPRDDSEEPLFRAAVFLCASMPFSLSLRAGRNCATDFDLTAAATDIVKAPSPLESSSSEDDDDDDGIRASGRDDVGSDSGYEDDEKEEEKKKRRTGSALPRRFDPSAHDARRIAIPTAHIIGKADRWASQGQGLAELCGGESARVLTLVHRWGHVIPRDQATSAAIAGLVESVVAAAR
ncbi:hypothetical protein MPH_12495 [Macrophomina phaseolina MS6]|uniref:Serine hydrolase domain-containing protein n=1 Tax=Macrophomina phaseolina (strain MS6) TaxID=1126212 RepID=K2QKL4_MACPH|nr:hypothetical protein MPH_12495 [Macrophomina phaseolina MS6]